MTQRNRSTLPGLVAAFAGLSAATIFFGFLFPLTPARMAKPTFELASRFAHWRNLTELDLPVPRTAVGVLVAVVAIAVISFTGYATALIVSWKARGNSPHIAWAFAPCILYCAAIAFMPNFDSDIYNYILRGRITAVYGENPYLVVADTFPDDAVYPYAEKRYTSQLDAAKLPSWKLVNISLAWLSRDLEPHAIVIVYRIAFLLLNVANVVLVWQILKRTQPDLAFFGVVAFGWNPIVVLFAQSKTDTVMVFYLLAGIFLLATGRQKLSAVFLALSAWTKLITLPLLGIQWLGQLKRREWRVLATSVAIFIAVTLLVYLPFWDGPHLIVRHLTHMDKAASSVPGLARTFISIGFVLLTLGAAYVQDGSLSRLLRSWTVVMLYFALFLTKLNLCWYLLIPIAVAAVTADWILIAVTASCSFCCLALTYRDVAFSRKHFPAPEIFNAPRFVVYLVIPALTFAAIAAYSLWSKRRALVRSGAAK